MPHARLVVIDEADHIIVLNHPDAVGNAIEEFLTRPLADEAAAPRLLRAKPRAEVDQAGHHEDGDAVLHDAKAR